MSSLIQWRCAALLDGKRLATRRKPRVPDSYVIFSTIQNSILVRLVGRVAQREERPIRVQALK
jgi:hypothetical protein